MGLLRGLSWMQTVGGGLDMRSQLSLPGDPCGRSTPRPTPQVLPPQEGSQLPRWHIAVKGLCILWNGDNKSNPNYWMDVLVKWQTLSETAMTPEFILLGLIDFLSFRVIFPILAQADMSNMSPDKIIHSQLCFPSISAFSVKSFCTISLVRRLCVLFFITKHIHYWFLCCSLVSHRSWHFVGSHLTFVKQIIRCIQLVTISNSIPTSSLHSTAFACPLLL